MKPDAIITSDLHLREDRPVCRTDDYFKAQTLKLNWLNDLQKEHECPILDGADIFNKWKPSPFLLRHALINLPDIITVPGNHDLPYHSMDSYDRCGLGVLEQAGKVIVLKEKSILINEINKDSDCYALRIYGIPYGRELPVIVKEILEYRVLILHAMCWHKNKPYHDLTQEQSAISILKKYPDFDLIITGHNHQSFVVPYKGRLLVNPGSMMRMTADQIDFRPKCYLWYAEANKVKRMYYPISSHAITRDHITQTQERDERLESFISSLDENVELGLSFEHNMENYISSNKISKRTKEILWEVINE